VGVVFEAEVEGEERFAASWFNNTRDRAELGAPYPDLNGNREHVVDVEAYLEYRGCKK